LQPEHFTSSKGYGMSKFNVDNKVDTVTAADQATSAGAKATTEAHHANSQHSGDTATDIQVAGAENNELLTNVVTIGVIGVGAALIEAALIPGIVIGVAAAFAPKYVPQIGNKLRPLFKSTVSGVVKLSQKTREAVAETREQMQDLVAEVKAEHQGASTVPFARPAVEPGTGTHN
jgi:hypothetical protein